jgi:hypothetical protein
MLMRSEDGRGRERMILWIRTGIVLVERNWIDPIGRADELDSRGRWWVDDLHH